MHATVHPRIHHRLGRERAAGHLAEPVSAARNGIARVDDAVVERFLALAPMIQAVFLEHHLRVLLGHPRERAGLFELLHVRTPALLADQAEDGLAELSGRCVAGPGVGLRAFRGRRLIRRRAEKRESARQGHGYCREKRKRTGVERPCHLIKLNRRGVRELRWLLLLHVKRGSQDSNLESPVLETGALASWATAPSAAPEVIAMRAEGLEPPRSFEHEDLNLARLPIPTRPREGRF